MVSLCLDRDDIKKGEQTKFLCKGGILSKGRKMNELRSFDAKIGVGVCGIV